MQRSIGSSAGRRISFTSAYITRTPSIALTGRLGRYLESLLDGGDGAVEVGVTGGEYAAEHTVKEHVGLLVGESLQDRALEAPYATRGVVGDGQLPEDILEAPGRRGGRRGCSGRRGRHLEQLQVLRPVLLVVRVARVVLHLRLGLVVATVRGQRATS